MTKEERKEYSRNYYLKNKIKILAKGSQYHKENKNYKKEYYEKYYEKNKEEIDIRNKKYKEDNVGYDKKYYEINRENAIEKQKSYYGEHRIDAIEKQKIYNKNNKKKRNEYMKIYLKERKEEDPLFNLTSSIRSLIYSSIKNEGYSKESKTQEILGCSYLELKDYLEGKFLEGMSWENKGEWHIDHIKPTSLAKTEEEI